MPNVPFREQIMDNIASALRGIRQDAGFNFSVADVSRALVGPFNGNQFPQVSVYEGGERGAIDNYEQYERLLTVVCEGWVRESSPGSMASDLNLLLADMEKAVLEDYTRGGMALDTSLLDISPPIVVEGSREGAIVLFLEVHYRHSKFDAARF